MSNYNNERLIELEAEDYTFTSRFPIPDWFTPPDKR